MAKAHYTPEADQDLIRIGAGIAHDNPMAALRWIDAIEAVCGLLATQPRMGQRIKTKQFGEVRRHSAGNYLVYYRPIADGIEILTVVHGARDLGKLL
jgi:toxin ParE1/3/4